MCFLFLSFFIFSVSLSSCWLTTHSVCLIICEVSQAVDLRSFSLIQKKERSVHVHVPDPSYSQLFRVWLRTKWKIHVETFPNWKSLFSDRWLTPSDQTSNDACSDCAGWNSDWFLETIFLFFCFFLTRLFFAHYFLTNIHILLLFFITTISMWQSTNYRRITFAECSIRFSTWYNKFLWYEMRVQS